MKPVLPRVRIPCSSSYSSVVGKKCFSSANKNTCNRLTLHRAFSASDTTSTNSSIRVSNNEQISSINKIKDVYGVYSELSKARLSMLVVASGSAGFLLGGAPVALDTLSAVTLGTALSACAANTFNQVYEIRTDAKMKRTRRRPLPCKDFYILIFS